MTERKQAMVAALTPCHFTFDDGPVWAGFQHLEMVDGVSRPSRWNGFDNVAVDVPTRARICDWMRQSGDPEGADVFAAVEPMANGLISLGWGYATQIVTGWRAEFPDFDRMPHPMPDGFVDVSWHNDACPSFVNEVLGLRLSVDYADAGKREVPEAPGRFFVSPNSDGAADVLLQTDDWNEVLAFLADARAEMQAKCQHRDTGRGVCADCGAFL